MVYVFLADGFEECEALVPTDILRRGGVEVKTVGVGGEYITGSHGITVKCDITEDNLTAENLDGIILPGGMPGTLNLEKSDAVNKFITLADEKGLVIGAICAAPSILGHKGLLSGRKATCFPGFESELVGADFSDLPVIKDGNIITSCGAGAAFEFGFCLLSALKSETEAENLKKAMKFKTKP